MDEGPIVVTENYITLGTCDDNVNDRNGVDFHEQKQKKKDSKRQRKRYDSDDSLSQRDLKRDRKRFDSDDEDQRQASRKTSRRRYDSDDDDMDMNDE